MKKLKKVLHISILFLFCSPALSQPASFTVQNQQWIQDYAQFSLKHNLVAGIDGGLRWRNTFESVSQILTRLSLLYKFKNGLKLGGGFAYSGYFNSGYYSSTEYRPYQEFGFDKKSEKKTLQLRYRLEERFFTDYSNTLPSSNRLIFRNRLSFTFNFKLFSLGKNADSPQLWLTASDELFLNLPSSDATYWFDQNRVIAGPVLKFSNALAVQLTYNFQVGGTSVSHAYRITNVVWFSVRQSLDLSGK